MLNIKTCFVSVDPLQHKYPYYTPYQYAGNKPISYIDLDGLEPTKPGKETGQLEVDSNTNAKKDYRLWEWNGEKWMDKGGSSKPIEITEQKSNASAEWKSFISNLGTKGYQNYVNNIYQEKLAPYQINNGFNLGLYGTDENGNVNVPKEIKNKLWNEANSEAMPALKAAWASEKSGVNPNSLNYTLNPLARAQYNYWRALAVSSSSEGWGIYTNTALVVAISWTVAIMATKQAISAWYSQDAKGGGISFSVNEKRTLGLDWHKFKIGGRKTGDFVNRPHIDISGLKLWPWRQIDKLKRGVK